MFTCAGVAHFTGSAEVVTDLLTGGTQASRLHWGKTSGTWGVAEAPSEISEQDAWQRQERLDWVHWVDKRVCGRDDVHTCVGRGGEVCVQVCRGILGWRVHMCGGDPFYRQRRSCYWFTYSGDTSINASLGKDIGSMGGSPKSRQKFRRRMHGSDRRD